MPEIDAANKSLAEKARVAILSLLIMGIAIRLLTLGDLPFADSLRALAGWNQMGADWKRLLDHDPQGCFLAEWDGQPAGTVTTTTYSPALAWIGMLLVHPNFRKRGIGRALLQFGIEHLRNTGIQCIKLDATPQGLPLYQQLGFHAEWTLRRWQGAGISVAQGSPFVRSATTMDLPSIFMLDAQIFGVSRERLLKSIVEHAERVIVNERGGEVTGFGLMREGARATYLGPISAGSATEGRNIAMALLADRDASGPVFLDIPDPNTAAVAQAGEISFIQQRELTRMYLGENVSCRVEGMFGIAGPEVG